MAEGLLEGRERAVGAHHQVGPVARPSAVAGRRRHRRGHDRRPRRGTADRQAAHEHRRLVGPPPQLGDRRRRLVVDDLDRAAVDPGEHRLEQAPPQGADLRRHGVHAGVGDHGLHSILAHGPARHREFLLRLRRDDRRPRPFLRDRAGRDPGAARAERRRQDLDHAGDHGPCRDQVGRRARRRDRHHPHTGAGARRARSRPGAGGAAAVLRSHRGGEPDGRRLQPQPRRRDAQPRARAHAVPPARRAAQPARGLAVGRRAADAGDRPRSHVRAAAAAGRRAVARPDAQDGRSLPRGAAQAESPKAWRSCWSSRTPPAPSTSRTMSA